MAQFLSEHWLDMLTTILGLAYILLEYHASIWLWVVGFFMQSLGIVLYYQKGLYADCGMEFYYLAMTAYGFMMWKRKATSPSSLVDKAERESSITHIPLRLAMLWTAIALALWVLIWFLLSHFTDIPFKASLYGLYILIAVAGYRRWRQQMKTG